MLLQLPPTETPPLLPPEKTDPQDVPCSFDFAVLGAGVVGAAIALGLVRGGCRVVLFDGDDTDRRAARGNGGLVWVHGKGAAMPAYRALTCRSARAWPELAAFLLETTGIDVELTQRGGLDYFLDEAEFAARRAQLAPLNAGSALARIEFLDRGTTQSLNPRLPLGPAVIGASYCALDGTVHPLRLLRALQSAFLHLGGVMCAADRVQAVAASQGGFRVEGARSHHEAAHVVIAAGLGTAPLARELGLAVEVLAERGQMLMSEKVAPLLDLPAGGVRQLREGTLQFGTTREPGITTTPTSLAGLGGIARRTLAISPVFASVRLVRAWGCLRVLSRDGCPVYAESPTHPGAFVAFCHSGVTLAAAHAGELAAGLARGGLPASLAPFHPGRFNVPHAA